MSPKTLIGRSVTAARLGDAGYPSIQQSRVGIHHHLDTHLLVNTSAIPFPYHRCFRYAVVSSYVKPSIPSTLTPAALHIFASSIILSTCLFRSVEGHSSYAFAWSTP